ncbi:MAG: hypothetical protein LBD24_00095 [Spirochaetaceae bacterium]|jgi:hypothetical protein|nr:hypothetical protein [Spirochaetaceae bacterium]
MRTRKPIRFIALIPHRDSAALIERYRTRLFAAGVAGAYSFPVAAPLAAVSRAFTPSELKNLARTLRNTNPVISFGTLREESWPPFTFCGPELNMTPPELAEDRVLWRCSPPLLCAALITTGESRSLPPPPTGSFRAALVANLIIRALGQGHRAYSFEWNTGTPFWLPTRRRSLRLF